MAPIKFTKAILNGDPIDVYNHGYMKRNFTYVDDLVEAIRLLINATPKRPISGETVPDFDSISSVAPYRVVNIGNGAPVPLMDFIAAIETALEKSAQKNMMDMQPGDVPATWADTTLLKHLTGYTPKIGVTQGVACFVDWYKQYYGG